MGIPSWGKPGQWLCGAFAALLLATGPVRADDVETVIRELKAQMEAMRQESRERIEAMERQNQMLQEKLDQVQRQQGGAEASEQAGESPPRGLGDVNEDQVKRIISDYMKEDAARKKAADEAAKTAERQAFSEVVNNTPMSSVFENGVLFSSKNKAFTMRVGTEVQEDAVWQRAPFNVEYAKGGVGPVDDGINTRRARIDLRGTIWDNFEYMMQWDFGQAAAVNNAAGQTVNFGGEFNAPMPIELWGMFTDLPLVRNIRIGNQKPLWSFENWNSSRFQDFMERSLGWDAFVNLNNNAYFPSIVMLNWTENERMTFQVGVFKNVQNFYFWQSQNGDTGGEARVSFLPWYCDNGRYLLHLGLGGMVAGTPYNTARYRARNLLRPTAFVDQNVMSEARMYSDRQSTLVPEFYMNLGPWSIQAEYYVAWANNVGTIPPGTNPMQTLQKNNLGTFTGYGYYAQVTYFLTGEYHPYNKQLGRIERVIPHTNFFWHRCDGRSLLGSGAWLTGLRYSWLDLRDLGLNGSAPNGVGATASSAAVWDVTYTLEWIVNPNVRVLWNAIYEDRQAATTPQSNGPLRGFGMRLQLDF